MCSLQIVSLTFTIYFVQFQSIHLTQQMDYFSTVYEDVYKQLGSSDAEKHFSKSIFAIVIGNNDILGYFRSSDLRNKTTPRQYVDSDRKSVV